MNHHSGATDPGPSPDPARRRCPCCAGGALEERRLLLGADYDPHGGFAAVRREAAFYTWCESGRPAGEFAAHLAEAERLREDTLTAELGEGAAGTG